MKFSIQILAQLLMWMAVGAFSRVLAATEMSAAEVVATTTTFSIVQMTTNSAATTNTIAGVKTMNTERDNSSPIVVEGWAPIISAGDITGARQVAIHNALAMAVEQRLGTSIDTRRESFNHVLIENRIRQAVKGDIARYKILEEQKREFSYWVRLAVELRVDEVQRLELGKLRVAIVTGRWDGKPGAADNATDVHDTRLALAERLGAQGMHVVGDEDKKALKEFSAEELRKVAGAARADLVLFVEVERSTRPAMAGLQLAEIQLRARLFDPVTAGWTQTSTVRQTGERDGSLEKSAGQAVERASEELTDRILDALTAAVKANEGGGLLPPHTNPPPFIPPYLKR